MSLTISETPSYEPAPAGLHNAICVTIADLGLQHTAFGVKNQVLFTWEIEELMEDGRPFTLSRRFSSTLSKKGSLRPFLESWRGRVFTTEELKGFKLAKVLGANCQLMVQHNLSQDGTRTYANVASIVPAAKGVKLDPKNELLLWDFDAPDTAVKAKLSEWVIKLIDGAVISEIAAPTQDDDEHKREDFDDSIPF